MSTASLTPAEPLADPLVLVLPFAASDGTDGAYLAEGVSDELTLALTRLAGVSVLARGTAAALRGAFASPHEAARSVGANVVVTGQAARSGAGIDVQLTVTSADDPANRREARAHLLPEAFTAGVTDLATTVADFCGVAVTEAWRIRSSHPLAAGAEVFDLLLRGRYHLEQRPIGVKLAMQCFDRAIRLDATVAGAYGALGALWANFGIFLALPPHQARERAREQAQRALAIDPGEPSALAALMTVATFYDWDLALADQLGSRLLHDFPSWVIPRQVLLYAHAARGHAEAVATLGRQVQRLDPWSVDPVNDYGFALILIGEAMQATVVLEAHLVTHPEASEVHRRLGLAWVEAGDATRAVHHLERSVALSRRHAWGVANLACARARAGDTDGARALLAELEERAEGELVPAVALAEIHASLGAADAAFAALERALAARDYWLLAVGADPLLAPLRSDPRFAAFQRRCVPPPSLP